MSRKNLHTFSPHPTPSIFQGMEAERQPFWLAFRFEGTPAFMFPDAAMVSEI